MLHQKISLLIILQVSKVTIIYIFTNCYISLTAAFNIYSAITTLPTGVWYDDFIIQDGNDTDGWYSSLSVHLFLITFSILYMQSMSNCDTQ